MPLCIIPARGGSKRIPRKNIKPFNGKPMIAHSIAAAQLSGCFSQIIVSTDDPEIAAIAQQYGASVPFTRPHELANDYATTGAVIAHAVQWMQQHGWQGNAACCLYATAPFVQPHDLQQGFAALTQECTDYAFSITSFPFPIQRALKLHAGNQVAMFQPENFAVRSQDLAEAWLAQKPIFNSHSIGIKIPRHRVQDIDTPEDWIRAEILYRLLQAYENEQP